MRYSITPLGDSALVVDFGNTISEDIHTYVLSLAQAIGKAGLEVQDVVPAYSSVSVYYDVIRILKKYPTKGAFSYMSEQMETLLARPFVNEAAEHRLLHVPVCYSHRYGQDLKGISEHKRLSVEEIIHLHTARRYKVYMIGFLPGFAYMGVVDEKIAVPRRQEPRLTIEAGSVGIAGNQTGIYPLDSPGGWQIIGRTPVKPFDKQKEDPVFFKAGDEVQFYSITEHEFENY